MMWWWEGGPWFFGPVMMIVFMLIYMAMMFFMMRGMMGGHGRSRDSVLGILNERLARGEISQAQYDEMRRVLQA
jgi:uncharacterized membrane protein